MSDGRSYRRKAQDLLKQALLLPGGAEQWLILNEVLRLNRLANAHERLKDRPWTDPPVAATDAPQKSPA